MMSPVIVPAGAGAVFHAFGDSITVKLGGEQTGGAMAVLLDTTPAKSGPPPHIHHHEDELFIIATGRYRFLVDGEWSEEVGPGTVAFLPRGSLHTFQNVGDEPSTHWIITTPSGFEQFFTKCAGVFAAAGPEALPDMREIKAISAEHGLEFVPPLPDEVVVG